MCKHRWHSYLGVQVIPSCLFLNLPCLIKCLFKDKTVFKVAMIIFSNCIPYYQCLILYFQMLAFIFCGNCFASFIILPQFCPCVIVISKCIVACYQCQHHVTLCLMSINVTPTGINRSFNWQRTPWNHVARQTLFSSTRLTRGHCCCQDSCLTAKCHTVSNCDQSPMMQAYTFSYYRDGMGIGVTLIR